jgi:carbamoylphosphate synthase large subunit
MNCKTEIGRKSRKCIIIFSGFNQRAIIAFLRTLKKNNLDYVIIAKSEADNIFLTEYANKVLAVRRSVPLDLEDILETIKIVQNKCDMDEYIIAPTSEALNRFLLEHKGCFNKIGCKIPLIDKELYETISDKYSFGEICSKNGICTPKELRFNEISTLPVVAKPKKYFSSSTEKTLSPQIISNSQELISFSKEQNIEDYYFQEYISGSSLYLLYYFSKYGMIYKFSQENIIQQPDGKSMVAAISSDFHNTAESERYERMFEALNFFGLVMIEVKQKNGINYMIEANPRFWGPSQLFVDAGVNLFEAFLYDLGMLDKSLKFSNPPEIIHYFWFGGIIEAYEQNKQLKYHQGDELDFMYSLPMWLQSDVYRRADTVNIFKKEVFE